MVSQGENLRVAQGENDFVFVAFTLPNCLRRASSGAGVLARPPGPLPSGPGNRIGSDNFVPTTIRRRRRARMGSGWPRNLTANSRRWRRRPVVAGRFSLQLTVCDSAYRKASSGAERGLLEPGHASLPG
jgi:hypothetical protein